MSPPGAPADSAPTFECAPALAAGCVRARLYWGWKQLSEDDRAIAAKGEGLHCEGFHVATEAWDATRCAISAVAPPRTADGNGNATCSCDTDGAPCAESPY